MSSAGEYKPLWEVIKTRHKEGLAVKLKPVGRTRVQMMRALAKEKNEDIANRDQLSFLRLYSREVFDENGIATGSWYVGLHEVRDKTRISALDRLMKGVAEDYE